MAGGLRQPERVGRGAQPEGDHVAGVVRGEAHLLLDVIAELVIAPVCLADVHAEIPHGREDEEAEEATDRAGTTPRGHQFFTLVDDLLHQLLDRLFLPVGFGAFVVVGLAAQCLVGVARARSIDRRC
jgi:hypothetical protein